MENRSLFINEQPKCYFVPILMDYSADIGIAGLFIAVLDSIFTPLAILGNITIIAAIIKTPSLQSPSNFLIGCLAVTDFITGLTCLPMYAVFKIGEFYKDFEVVCLAYVSATVIGWAIASVSCCTLCMISVERFLAIHFHLRYHELVTIKKLIVPVILCWIFFILFSTSRFYTKDTVAFTWTAICILVVVFFIIFYCYAKIFAIVKRHRSQIESHAQTSTPTNGQISGEVNLSCDGQKKDQAANNHLETVHSKALPGQILPGQSQFSMQQQLSVPGRQTTLHQKVSFPGKENIAIQANMVDKRQFLRYRKSTITMFIILGCFLVAYIPLLFAQIAIQVVGYVPITKILYEFSATLVFINSSINPIVYCWRMEHLRRACARLLPLRRNNRVRDFSIGGSTWAENPRTRIFKEKFDNSIG